MAVAHPCGPRGDDLFELTGWDYLAGVIVLLSVGFGFWRGLIKTVFALAGWLAALLAIPTLAPLLVVQTGMQNNAWVIYIAVFLVVLIGVRLVGRALARGARSAGLGGADRGLGALLGAGRALIVIVALVAVAKAAGLTEHASWQSALSRPLLEQVLTWIEPYLPEKVSGIRRA